VCVASASALMRVAALADVHGNAPALAAVLDEVERDAPDLVVFCGDLTWGSLVQETLALVRALEIPTRFVRGNADRAVAEDTGARGEWIRAQHSADDLAYLSSFEPTVTVDVDELGRTCFAHGSPRSDEECVTERTPTDRIAEFMGDRTEECIVTAHVHVRYERVVDGVRLLSPGSVGVPYEGRRGAFWALLGPTVELRRTDYDVESAVELMLKSGDPDAGRIGGMILDPPARDDVIADAERRVFAG
jgi:predicted phosphodiesterase